MSSTRITVFSPRVAGKVLTRRSILRPSSSTWTRPSCGRRRSLMSMRGHDLDAAGHGAEQVQRHFQRLVQPAVDAVADAHAAFGRLDVDVAGPFLDRVVR